MVLDWLNAPVTGGSPNLRELIARKKYAKAIALLRAQLEGRISPGPQMRLQLADLLVLAGRGGEAVPILVGLADEFARDGFVAKAVAILKRVDRIEPGRADVEERLVSLVRQQQRDAAAAPVGRRAAAPALGMAIERTEPAAESVAEAAATAPVAAELPVSDWPALVTGAPPPPEDATLDSPAPEATGEAAAEAPATCDAEGREASAEGEHGSVVGRIKGVFRRFLSSPDESEDAAASAEPASLAAPESAAPLLPAIVLDVTVVSETSLAIPEAAPAAEVAHRIRNVFKRFLAALPSPSSERPPVETAGAESAVEAVSEDADATDEEKLVVDETELPSLPILAAEASFAEPAAPPPAVLEEPATEITADAIVVDEAAPMSQEIFEDRVLDLIENVLQRPAAPDASDPGTAAQELASRLIASPLFGELAEGEMLAVVHELRLLTAEPGDVIVTEGEPGDSLFIITTGAVKVFVRNPDGRNFVVGRLEEGNFFGEISSLSGRRRSATVVAASRCELLSLEKKALDSIARKHPRLRDVLETRYIERAGSPEAAAVRAVPLGDAGTRERAIEILEAHFGESRWDPRMRLRLANLLLKAGKDEDAVPILVGLADDLARQGFPEKAIAILKKIERIRRRDVEEVNLAPLRPPGLQPKREARPRRLAEAARAPQKPRPKTAAFFEAWIVDVVRDTVRSRLTAPGRMQREERVSPDAAALEAYGRGLKASPLFEDYSEDELLALVEGLRLSNYEPGDVILTEGEPGRSVFMLAGGTVRVFVRDRAGHDVALCTLGPGSFFGEIAALSGRPRSATVVAAARCELLELDKPTLDAISLAHPRIRVVLEDFYIARAGSPEAASIRTARPDSPAH